MQHERGRNKIGMTIYHTHIDKFKSQLYLAYRGAKVFQKLEFDLAFAIITLYRFKGRLHITLV